uniref:F-box domain-containing protein n=1 Tax=Pristionchus pacificus TaxID=54126 RepID=A0A8R1UWS4_PRIPA
MTTAEEIHDVRSLSLFEKTPKEITWKIFFYVPEAIDNIRMTSSLLRSRMDGYLNERGTVPYVLELRMTGAKPETRRLRKTLSKTAPPNMNNLYVCKWLEYDERFDKIDFVIRIPVDFMALFEHRLRVRSFPCDLVESKIWANVTDYFLQLDVKDDWNLISLRDVIGRHVNHACLRNCSETEELTAVNIVIDGIDINYLEYEVGTLTEQIGETLFAAVREHNIDRLILVVESYYKFDRVEFLLKMSELVNGLQLTQNFAHPKNPGVKHFFDSTDVYWADVIVNMLSRKLNILCIENQDYPEYLRNHAVEELMERLPALDKKLWFYATCDTYENLFSFMEKEHLVKIERNGLLHFLSVKHSSRINELPSNPE